MAEPKSNFLNFYEVKLLSFLKTHKKPLSISGIASKTGFHQITTGKHLAILGAKGLVDCHREGKALKYELTKTGIKALGDCNA